MIAVFLKISLVFNVNIKINRNHLEIFVAGMQKLDDTKRLVLQNLINDSRAIFFDGAVGRVMFNDKCKLIVIYCTK